MAEAPGRGKDQRGGEEGDKKVLAARPAPTVATAAITMQRGQNEANGEDDRHQGANLVSSTPTSSSGSLQDCQSASNKSEGSANATFKDNKEGGGSKKNRSTLRKGKWTVEEEEYTSRIIHYFNAGLLNLPDGATLRSYLAEKLNCDPMRITKKYAGAACVGRRALHYRDRAQPTMAEIQLARAELDYLERRFRLQVELGLSSPMMPLAHPGTFGSRADLLQSLANMNRMLGGTGLAAPAIPGTLAAADPAQQAAIFQALLLGMVGQQAAATGALPAMSIPADPLPGGLPPWLLNNIINNNIKSNIPFPTGSNPTLPHWAQSPAIPGLTPTSSSTPIPRVPPLVPTVSAAASGLSSILPPGFSLPPGPTPPGMDPAMANWAFAQAAASLAPAISHLAAENLRQEKQQQELQQLLQSQKMKQASNEETIKAYTRQLQQGFEEQMKKFASTSVSSAPPQQLASPNTGAVQSQTLQPNSSGAGPIAPTVGAVAAPPAVSTTQPSPVHKAVPPPQGATFVSLKSAAVPTVSSFSAQIDGPSDGSRPRQKKSRSKKKPQSTRKSPPAAVAPFGMHINGVGSLPIPPSPSPQSFHQPLMAQPPRQQQNQQPKLAPPPRTQDLLQEAQRKLQPVQLAAAATAPPSQAPTAPPPQTQQQQQQLQSQLLQQAIEQHQLQSRAATFQPEQPASAAMRPPSPPGQATAAVAAAEQARLRSEEDRNAGNILLGFLSSLRSSYEEALQLKEKGGSDFAAGCAPPPAMPFGAPTAAASIPSNSNSNSTNSNGGESEGSVNRPVVTDGSGGSAPQIESSVEDSDWNSDKKENPSSSEDSDKETMRDKQKAWFSSSRSAVVATAATNTHGRDMTSKGPPRKRMKMSQRQYPL